MYFDYIYRASLVAQVEKNLSPMQEMQVHFCFEKVPYKRTWQHTPVFLPGESSWTEDIGGLQSMGFQWVRHDWATKNTYSNYISNNFIYSQLYLKKSRQFSSVQSLSRVQIFATPWTATCQASLSINNTRSSLRLTSIESVMSSRHLILCRSLLLLLPIPLSIRVFSNESTLCMRWPKNWRFSFNIIPSKKTPGWSPSEWTFWISLQSKGPSRVLSSTTVQKHQFFGAQLSSQSNSCIHTWPQEKP